MVDVRWYWGLQCVCWTNNWYRSNGSLIVRIYEHGVQQMEVELAPLTITHIDPLRECVLPFSVTFGSAWSAVLISKWGTLLMGIDQSPVHFTLVSVIVCWWALFAVICLQSQICFISEFIIIRTPHYQYSHGLPLVNKAVIVFKLRNIFPFK